VEHSLEASEIAETIPGEHHHVHHAMADDRFRKLVAIYIGFLAMLLAITSLGGSNAMKETINANITASDTYSFYQARNIRQTSTALAADELEILLATRPDLPDEAAAAVRKKIDSYRAVVQRYESDPAAGTGKKELLEKAQSFEHRRDEAQRRDLSFEFAAALLQIAIVLGSVAIAAASRSLLGCSAILAALGALLSVNGFFLLVELPLH
jgi:hypothetical protein